MINTNELMRGNYLQYKIDSNYLQYKIDSIKEYKICRVSEIKLIEVRVEFVKDNIFKTVFEEELEPIPITEEILKKCGFRTFDGYYINEDNVIVSSINGSWYLSIASTVIIKLTYLHQLQNLYLLIVGKQLEINL